MSKRKNTEGKEPIEGHAQLSTRPKRKRKPNFPYGSDFVPSATLIKQEKEDESDECVDSDGNEETWPMKKSIKHERSSDIEAEEEEQDASELDPITGEFIPKKTKCERSGEEDDDELCERQQNDEAIISKPCLVVNKADELPLIQVIKLLDDYDNKLCESLFDYPKAGEVYLYDTNIVQDLWTKDEYKWESKLELSTLTYEGEKIIKTVVNAIGDDSSSPLFSRITFYKCKKENIILVHYTGDEGPYIKNIKGSQSNAHKPFIVDKTPVEIEYENVLNLDYRDVLDLLEDCYDKLRTEPPILPKAGEIHFYDTNVIGSKWKCDHYVWRNCGFQELPRKNPMILKTFFLVRLSSNDTKGSPLFRRIVYQKLDKPNIILVHYTGDDRVYEPHSHGNRKFGNDAYIPGKKNMPTRLPKTISTKYCQKQKEEKSKVLRKAMKKSRIRSKEKACPSLTTPPDSYLAYDIAMEVLELYDGDCCVNAVLFPKAGEAYLYNTMDIDKRWKDDGYYWADQRATHYHPRENPLIIRRIYPTLTSEKKADRRFERCVFSLLNAEHIILVHYIGDESHGVKKISDLLFVESEDELNAGDDQEETTDENLKNVENDDSNQDNETNIEEKLKKIEELNELKKIMQMQQKMLLHEIKLLNEEKKNGFL